MTVVDWMKKDRRSDLQVERDRLVADLKLLDPDSDEYKERINHLKTINQLLGTDKKDIPIGPIITAVGTIGAAIITGYVKLKMTDKVTTYEEEESITSKMWSKI